MATCRICLEGAESGALVQPCMCNGFDIGHFHQECLQTWVDISGNEKCEICKTEFRQTYTYYFDKRDYCKRVVLVVPSSQFERKILVASIPSMILINICTLMAVVCKVTDIVEINHIAYLSTSIILWPSVAMQLIRRDLPFFVLNIVMVWKSAFTFLVCVSCLVFITYADNECVRECITLRVPEGCSDTCPIYPEYLVAKEEILISMQTDLIQFAIVFILRAIVQCTQRKKKRVFISLNEV